MMRKFLVWFLLWLLVPTQVLADGIIVPPPNQNITSAQQKAVIVYQNEKEDLIISLEFSGDAKEFAWIIPLPSKPEVKKGKDELFTKLGQLTKPKENLLDKIRGRKETVYPMNLGAKQEMAPSGRGVEVIETKRVGILETVVLKASKASELEKWLSDNGFELPPDDSSSYLERSSNETLTQEVPSVVPSEQIGVSPLRPAGIDKALQIFQDYIDDDWYFVAAKVSPEFLRGTNKEMTPPQATEVKTRVSQTEIAPVYPFTTAHITPLELTFSTKKIVYPMKISSLSSSSPSVLLYVISDHRQKVSNYSYEYYSGADDEENVIFKTEYAAKIKASDLAEWLPNLNDGYLTKLYASYLDPGQMTEDLRFENFKNDQTVNTGEMTLSDWLKVIPLLSIYGPVRIVGFLTSAQNIFGGPIVASIFLVCLGGGLGLVWTSIFYILLSRTRRRLLRFIIYLLQFPGLWLLANTLSLIIIIPTFIMMAILKIDEDVILFTLLLRNNLGACLFTALLYMIQAKIHLLFRREPVGERI